MNITDIRIRRLFDSGKLKAIVSLTIDSRLVIHEIKIVEGTNGLFLAMPSKKASDGVYLDIVHPIDTALRTEMSEAVLAKYQEVLSLSQAD